MQRRNFLKTLAGSTAYATIAPRAWAAPSSAKAEIRCDFSKVLQPVPADFTGLSYESAQLAHPKFFSASNASLIALFKQLSPAGVLRIGGNTSAYTHWRPDARASDAAFAEPPSAGKNTADSYTISTDAIDSLRAFLQATGWRLIYGLNIENGTAEAAAEEAAYVSKVCGDRLIAFQFGNEPDLFHHDDANHTPWTFDEYWSKWQEFARALRARVPAAQLAGPDAAYRMDWVEQFAQRARGQVVLLTGHYYIGGPPANPAMNLDALLNPPRHLLEEIPRALAAAKVAGVPYRMAEGNSCYQGGKKDVSDTFASALWVGDYMLQLAQAGYCGVNLHGGGEGWYAPIATDAAGASSRRPEFYGIQLAQHFAGAEIVLCRAESMANVTAYAARAGSQKILAIFNKSPQRLELKIDQAIVRMAAILSAASLDSKNNINSSPVFETSEIERAFSRTHSFGSEMEPYSACLLLAA